VHLYLYTYAYFRLYSLGQKSNFQSVMKNQEYFLDIWIQENNVCLSQHFPIHLQDIYASHPPSIWCLIDCCCDVKDPSSLICIPCFLLRVWVGINTQMLLEARPLTNQVIPVTGRQTCPRSNQACRNPLSEHHRFTISPASRPASRNGD